MYAWHVANVAYATYRLSTSLHTRQSPASTRPAVLLRDVTLASAQVRYNTVHSRTLQ